MAIIREGNWSFQDPRFQDGDVVYGGNFTQLFPDTEICVGVENVTVHGGNFVNCKVPAGWKLQGGNWCQISFCSHLRPDLIAHGLPVCQEDCSHRDGDKKQWVEVEEEEYREQKNSLSSDKSAVRIEKSVDADEVTVQIFQKEVFVYENTLTKNGAQVKKAHAASKLEAKP